MTFDDPAKASKVQPGMELEVGDVDTERDLARFGPGLNRNGVKAEPEEVHTLLDLLSDCDEGARSAGKAEEPRGKVH